MDSSIDKDKIRRDLAPVMPILKSNKALIEATLATMEERDYTLNELWAIANKVKPQPFLVKIAFQGYIKANPKVSSMAIPKSVLEEAVREEL